MTALPTPFPRALYTQARTVTGDYCALVEHVSRSASFLQTSLSGAAAADPDFLGRLLKMHAELYTGSMSTLHTQMQLGLFRADFMTHQQVSRPGGGGGGGGGSSELVLRQVEMNCISVSFGALSGRVSSMHRSLTRSLTHSLTLLLPSVLRFT